MRTENLSTRILEESLDDFLLTWVETWLIDCQVRNLSQRTIGFYREKIQIFLDYAETQAISHIHQLTANELRRFLLHLQASHNPGGVHAVYRTLRACIYFWEAEIEPDNWRNPFKRVKAPEVDSQPLQPVDAKTVRKMADTCKEKTLVGERDRAILMALLDTGCRAGEFLRVDLGDIDLVKGSILLQHTKGRKPRTVFLGSKARKAVRAYLKQRTDNHPCLWVNDEGERLKEGGLRSMVRRRAELAGLGMPGLHDFRRGCAIMMWRGGADVLTISRYLGHKDITTTKLYLKQDDEDLATVHRKTSPVDRFFDA